MDNLDEIDKKILRELQENSRLTTKELAGKVNLSTTPVYERVKRLENEGYIKKYVAVLDPEKLNLGFTVYVNVELVRQSYQGVQTFADRVKDIPEVTECYSVAGKTDFILKIHAPSMRYYKEFVLGVLGRIDNVKHIDSRHVGRFSGLTTLRTDRSQMRQAPCGVLLAIFGDKTLACAFPAVVAPQPILWSATDCVLQEGKIAARKLEWLKGGGIVGKLDETPDVSSAPLAAHVEIIDGAAEHTRQTFGAGEDGGVVIEEIHEAVYRIIQWHLVGDVAHNRRHACLTVTCYPAQCVGHCHTLRSPAAPEFQEGVVHPLVLQRMIYLSGPALRRQVERYGADPFPVAVMA